MRVLIITTSMTPTRRPKQSSNIVSRWCRLMRWTMCWYIAQLFSPWTGPAHLILGISAQNSSQVALIPGGPQPLPLDAPLRCALLLQQAQRQPTQEPEVLRGILLLDPAPVLVERHVQDPME